MIDLSRARRKPFAHQVVGVERLVSLTEPEKGRLYPGGFLLADQMRLGKTYQIINAAQVLFERGLIDKVIVVCPAPVRDVWYDPEIGEIQKHRWEGLPTLVTEFHVKVKKWSADVDEDKPYLTWIITNYEYARWNLRNSRKEGWTGPYLEPLFRECGPKTWLVLDESSAVTEWSAATTRACYALRRRCKRVTMLNGTPFGESPEDLYSQARMMDQRIFNLENISQYRSKYAIMGGYQVEVWNPRMGKKVLTSVEILGWRHRPGDGCCDIPKYVAAKVHEDGPGLEDIQERLAPYILRRMREDCFDMPRKLDPISLTVALKPETWRIYKELRDELVSWLSHQHVAMTPQAGLKVMRLHQVTSGFLGGVMDEAAVCPQCAGSGAVQGDIQAPVGALADALNLASPVCPACMGEGTTSLPLPVQEVGREKLDLMMSWIKRRLREESDFRMLVWCRFKPELHRLVGEIEKTYPKVKVQGVHGGQNREERLRGLKLMHPDFAGYDGPAILVGTIGTGSQGLNMSGAHEVVFCSNDYSLLKRQQSEDRPQGPDQTQSVSYHDLIATGPKGQKTVDHAIAANLYGKRNLEKWTCSAWVTALKLE